MMNDYRALAQNPTDYYGYQPGNTYLIGQYRMYLHGGYWYYVDYPQVPPVRAARPHYRTGGTLGIFYKIMGTLFFFFGVGGMMVDDQVAVVIGAFFAAFGLFGLVMAVYDSMRNHPTAWRVGATAAVAAYAIHSLTDDDR